MAFQHISEFLADHAFSAEEERYVRREQLSLFEDTEEKPEPTKEGE